MTSPLHVAEEQPNQNLARALLLLEAFNADQPEWGVRELARHLGTNPATVYRMVATFHRFGYLEQSPATQRYALGPKGIELARHYLQRNPLPKLARLVFEQYAHRFEHNFYLGTRSRYEMVYLATLDGRGPVKVVVEMGRAAPLHTTAIGKVLLALESDEFIQEYIDNTGLRAATPQSITDPAALWRTVEAVRAEQYAINNAEHYQDVGAVGVPVVEQDGRVTKAVSLAYPQHLVDSGRLQVPELLGLAREIAQAISALVV